MKMNANDWVVLLITLVFIIVSKIRKLANGVKAVGNLPGLRLPFEPYGSPGAILPTSKWNPGLHLVWGWRKSMYNRFNSDTISVVPFIIGLPAVITSDVDVCRQILSISGRVAFGKRIPRVKDAVSYWGMNILLADGGPWRKHRRIVRPAFFPKLYELVWTQSLQLYYEMLDGERFENKRIVNVHDLHEIISNFSFFIIGRCGFDFPFKWAENGSQSMDRNVAFPEAIRYFADNLDIFGLPKVLQNLPFPRFRKLNKYINEIEKFMQDKIIEKENELINNDGKRQGSSIFSMLVQANQAESDAKQKLDYSELISDVFLMLFAGHETTSHTLAGTLACLAHHQGKQEEIADEILSVVGEDREPDFESYSKLIKVQAAFCEALRLFPPAYALFREAKQDCVLNIKGTKGEGSIPIFIQKDTQVVIDMIGLNRNPRIFEDPDEFKPERWYNISNDPDAILAFGMGPRSCIGRKFAITEAVCFLTMLLRDWKIEPSIKPGQNVDEWFSDISQCRTHATLSLGNIAVRFVRRT